jgi:hypothetical protein
MARYTVLLLSLFLFPSLLAAQSYDLRYRLEKGRTFRFKQTEQITALAQASDGRGTQIDRRTTRYFTISIENGGIDGVQYTFVQDTAIVDENTEDASVQRQNIDFQNILTRKPIRVRQSPSGKVESTMPLEPLNVEALLGPGATDAMFMQRAAVLPALPHKPLEPGLSWNEAQRDTLFPSKEHPRLGRGNGVRYLSHLTEYRVGDLAEVDNHRCIKVSWEGKADLEEKIIYPSLEEFNEDRTVSNGELMIAIDSGLPVKMDVFLDQENTRALFGDQNNVIPSSIRTHTTLELFSQ